MIQRANLDGTGVEDLITTGTSGLSNPQGVALDVSGGKMYWTDAGADLLQRADLDGSNVEDILTGADGLVFPRGVFAVPGIAAPALQAPAIAALLFVLLAAGAVSMRVSTRR